MFRFDQIWAPSENEHPSMLIPDSTTTAKIDNSKVVDIKIDNSKV